MSEWSRRAALQAIAGGAAIALAGCQSESTADRSVPSSRGREVTDYERETVRNAEGVALFAEGDRRRTETGRDEVGRYHRETVVVTSREDLDRLTFTDVPEARTLASFTEATDLGGQESVYLFSTSVSACYDLRLRQIEIDHNGPSAQFCRDLRPADVACSADTRETVGVAIRLPMAGDEFSGHGSGMSSTCARPTRPEPFDPDSETEAGEQR